MKIVFFIFIYSPFCARETKNSSLQKVTVLFKVTQPFSTPSLKEQQVDHYKKWMKQPLKGALCSFVEEMLMRRQRC